MIRVLIVLIILTATADPASATPDGRAAHYMPGEILVKFKPGTSKETTLGLHSKVGSRLKAELPLTGVQRVELPPGLPVEEAVAAYQKHSDVLYAEPNYVRRAFVLPGDPTFDSNNPALAPDGQAFFNRQWGLHNTGQGLSGTNNGPGQPIAGLADADIDAPEAWDITTGSSQIVIAVIDSGLDYTHPDLSVNVWANPADSWSDPANPTTGDGLDNDGDGYPDDFRGWDFVGTQSQAACPTTCDCVADDPSLEDNDPADPFGHGTHVAGITAAVGDNNVGIAGILWTARIMPLRIIDTVGCGSLADELSAIEYAVNHGARIINASFGGPDLSLSEEVAIRAANNAGIVFVAAAGNESSDNDAFPIYPASFNLPNVISVAASDSNDRLSPFSNFGKNRVDIAAPGDCVYSTTPQGAFFLKGKIGCFNNVTITSGYAYLTGTSMAAPHVAGVAGLLLSQDPSLTPEEVRAIILATADPLEAFKGRMASAGRLNAAGALRRVKGSGLIGGSGGCGFPIGMIRPDDRKPAPPAQMLFYLFGIFWPLLIPVIRKILRRRRVPRIIMTRRAVVSASGLLALMVLWPQTAAADEENPPFRPVHSLGVKLGHHRYDRSEYLDTNSGLVPRSDLAGLSTELEYDWRWRDDAGLSVTAGRYHSRTDLKDICCSSVEFSTNYLLLTPKHYSPIKPMEWYIGGGVGFYDFKREIHGLLSDHLSARLLGIHGVIGLSWPVLPRVSVFTEARYALAKVKSADLFGDALDVGGLNYSLGVAWRFPPAGLRKRTAD